MAFDYRLALSALGSVEKVSPPEPVYEIIQKDQVRLQILQRAQMGEFAAAARTVKDIIDIGRAWSVTSQDRLQKLCSEVLHESDQLVNSYHDPLRNGDLF